MISWRKLAISDKVKFHGRAAFLLVASVVIYVYF